MSRQVGQVGQVGRGGVDRASSSDARGPEFKPWPLYLKKYHFFTRNHTETMCQNSYKGFK